MESRMGNPAESQIPFRFIQATITSRQSHLHRNAPWQPYPGAAHQGEPA
jgi:hypothetical protein